MKNTQIATELAPAAIGPYAQGIKAGGMVFVSGQIPVNPATGELVTDIAAATKQSLSNLAAVLQAAGCSMDQVVKTTVFLSDLKNFAAMNEVYAGFFKVNPPARSTVEVGALPKGAVVEIEAIAVID
ncbi:MAG: yjgF [Firmicutes bacterium]|nr:yjgF [Bacillota bacterium]